MKPLKGIKVVDLTTYMATPATGRVLGEWGADVIKVEAAKGDPLRVTQAAVFNMPMSDEENLAFDMCNLNKRFISLNLKSETGAEVMDKLLAVDKDLWKKEIAEMHRYYNEDITAKGGKIPAALEKELDMLEERLNK